MRVYRLVKARYVAGALDGSGAKRLGGRWNSPGTALVYASQGIAIAALEPLVHLGRSEILGSYRLFSLEIPGGAELWLDAASLPDDWRADPAPASTAAVGDGWVASARSVALMVPSTLIPLEHHCLLNPAHPGFAAIAASATQEPFGFDPRLG